MLTRRKERAGCQLKHGSGWWAGATWGMRVAVVLAVTLYAFVVTINAWLCDDAYITFRTVDNFVHGYGLTWNVDERVQTYTHPLWMFLISFWYWITHEIYFTAIVISLLISISAVWLLAFRLARSAWGALVCVAILSLSKAFVEYSTSGLENPLTHLFLVLFGLVYVNSDSDHTRRLFRLSLIAGLATLNRMDTLFLFAPAIAVQLYQHRSMRSLVQVVLGLIPFAAWELFSLFYYGFLVPNTAYAKLNTHIPSLDLAKQGIRYFVNSLRLDPLTLVVTVLGILMVFVTRRAWANPLVVGVILYLGYVVWIGGDFMSGRFFAAPLFCVVVLIGRSDGLPDKMTSAAILGVLVVGLASPAPTLFSGGERDVNGIGIFDAAGIGDERRHLYPVAGLLRIGKPDMFEPHWAKTTVERQGDQRIMIIGAVGHAGFSGGPNVHVLDVLALGDPLLARLPSLWNPGWRIAPFGRLIPEGYPDTLQTGINVIEDPALHEYYDKLSMVTRGNLFDLRRIREIVRLNLGEYDHLINTVRYQKSPYVHQKVLSLDEVGDLKVEGTGWLAPGNIAMDEEGVEIRVDGHHLSEYIEVSLDSSDRYEIAFLSGGSFVDRVTVGPTEGGGLTIYPVHVPAEAATGDYDAIRVRPLDGDGRYSMGHLRFVAPGIPGFTGVSLSAGRGMGERVAAIQLIGVDPLSSPSGFEVELGAATEIRLVSFRAYGTDSCCLVYFKDGYQLAEQSVSIRAGTYANPQLEVAEVPRGVAEAGFTLLRIIAQPSSPGFALSDLSLFSSDDLEPFRQRWDFPKVEVLYRDFSTVRRQGTAWDDCTQILDERGLRVGLDSIHHDPFVEISVDHDDEYKVIYFKGSDPVGSTAILPRHIDTAGLRVDALDIPATAVASGYDAINVYPLSGDGLYSVGHVRLLTNRIGQ